MICLHTSGFFTYTSIERCDALRSILSLCNGTMEVWLYTHSWQWCIARKSHLPDLLPNSGKVVFPDSCPDRQHSLRIMLLFQQKILARPLNSNIVEAAN